MRQFDINDFANVSANFTTMMKQEQEKAEKHALNPRCKDADYGGVQSYISEVVGINCTVEMLQKIAKKYKF